ncbi:hypothetical protein Tsubulata_003747 [Turnera subulata]|uniref:PGG domain-containing protein n=1 Tax=Turnera subulata TaxID=218843 RepID=A0A9Q0JHB5_9ROSI|nr:hypothetical protein Tsubulata_003747 [Turnera subulata]
MGTPTIQMVTNPAVLLNDLGAETYENWKACMMAYMEAQDLWDEVMDEPNDSDEQAYQNKDWRKKNAAALLAIKTSCAPQILSSIRDIRSAKVAWDSLAQMKQQQLPTQQQQQIPGTLLIDKLGLLMDPTALPLCHIPINYQDWSTKMREYLLNKGVWYDIIEFFTNQPNDDRKIDYKTWRGKNAMALRAIQEACAPYIPPQVAGSGITSAKIAWETLANHKGWGLECYIEGDQKILTSIVSQDGSTPLHEATTAHQTEIARRLVQKMLEQELEIQSSNGHTPLHDAAHVGSTAIARILVQKNKALVQIRSVIGAIPVALASAAGYEDITRYLYGCTPMELLYPESGINGFQHCFGSASEMPTSKLRFERCSRKPDESIGILSFSTINNIYTTKFSPTINSMCLLIRGFTFSFTDELGLKQIYKMKLTNIYAMECIRCICQEIPTTDLSQFSENTVWFTLVAAVENGIEEIVNEILKAHPESIIAVDNKGRGLMMLAIAFRQEKIFNLMLRRRRYTKANITDYNYNNMLHCAGMPPPPTQLARISGAALQMQRELQWFKAVESIVLPSFWEYRNTDGDTPRQLFTKNHKQLRDDGEQWMKETASSCTVVGALIITMMFAGAFTVPGGNSGDGLPLFQRKTAFITFIISDAISLFSSSTSVLMFLGILTSRYAEDDFLKSLPKKLIIGLSTLFISIAAMMVAFCATIIIMLHGRLSVIIPVCLLAGIPVSLFVILQFPLLVEIFNSTYFGNLEMRKKQANYKID